ncbi:MAG: rhodanese-like domain-containing protein [Pseudomonadota bacterium]
MAALLDAPDRTVTIIDVRKPAAFAADPRVICGAIRRSHDAVDAWGPPLEAGADGPCVVVVNCVHGHEVSQGVVAALCARGIDALYLEGGLAAWIAARLPVESLPVESLPFERLSVERPS